ncbi:hypothetical protein [Pyrococcus kukulkanii]|uniref:Uncharacterized protein n=1 Tax=Pyrococcus kukulkanii TaxID=1609559 RepID=A0ABV4T814_9EURY
MKKGEAVAKIFGVPYEKVSKIVFELDEYIKKNIPKDTTYAEARRKLDKYVKEKYKGKDYYLALALEIGFFVDRVTRKAVLIYPEVRKELCEALLLNIVGPYAPEDFDNVMKDLLGISVREFGKMCKKAQVVLTNYVMRNFEGISQAFDSDTERAIAATLLLLVDAVADVPAEATVIRQTVPA